MFRLVVFVGPGFDERASATSGRSIRPRSVVVGAVRPYPKTVGGGSDERPIRPQCDASQGCRHDPRGRYRNISLPESKIFPQTGCGSERSRSGTGGSATRDDGDRCDEAALGTGGAPQSSWLPTGVDDRERTGRGSQFHSARPQIAASAAPTRSVQKYHGLR